MKTLVSLTIALVLSLCLGIGSLWAVTVIEGVQDYQLENGLTVILLENHKAPAATFQVWYRAGARNEAWGKTGLAHVFEHMMFKGTEHVSAAEFSRRIHAVGASYNAFTSWDFAGYFEKLASEHIQTALELEADRMQHLTFSRQEFETEKQVVMEERRLRVEDDPQAFLLEQVNAAAFQTQPYHWPVSGWMPDLRRLAAKDADNWYQTYYHPANACIVAVGDFNSARLIGKIRRIFGNIPTGNGPFRTAYADPPQQGERRVQVNSKKTRLPFLAIGYHVPNISGPDSYALEVLSTVLSGGRSARLLRNLRYEKQIARRIQSSYSLLSFDPDLFVIYAAPFPDVDLETLEAAVADEINKLQSEAVGERELEKAKNRLEAAFVFAQDSILHQAMLLARYQLSTGWREINNYIPAVHAVTAAEVQEAARRYLNPKNRTVGMLVPAAVE